MKPLELSMTAFGPFASTQVIDFRMLGERSFFLIHGATGAGKTTILDAICFALYGETSGNERKSEQMRSHHTKSSTPTQVTFEFALGKETYQVTRSLKKEKTKDGESEQSFKTDKAILKQRAISEAGDTEWVDVTSKWTKVTEEIERLFGFESKQFRQVMMLPQDKFQQLLKANSSAREDLFKTLFQTERFERVEQALKKEHEQLEEELDRLQDQRQLILQMAQVAVPTELADKRHAAAVKLQELNENLSLLRDIEKQAADRYSQGRDAQLKLDEQEQAAAYLKEKESKQIEFDGKRKALDRARLAAELIELENATSKEIDEAVKAERRYNEARVNVTKAQEAQRKAAGEYAQEQGRQSERDQARQEQNELQSFFSKVQELEGARRSYNSAKTELGRADSEHDGAIAKKNKLQDQLTQLEHDLAQADRIAQEYIVAQSTELNASQVHTQWNILDGIRGQLKTVQGKEGEARKRLQEAEQNLIHARKVRDRVEQIWLIEHAAILAGRLKEKEPCPVCGSTDHPNPAISSQTTPPDSELKNARDAVTGLEARKQKMQDEWTQHRDKIVDLEAERKPLLEFLGAKIHLTLGQIDAELRMAQAASQKAHADHKRIANLKLQLEPLKKQLAEADLALASVELERGEAKSKLASAQAILLEREHNIPAEIQDMQKLGIAKQKADAKVAKMEQALKLAQIEDEHTKNQLVASEATLQQLSKQALATRQHAEDLEQQLESRVKAGGFADVDDYRSAKLPSQSIMSLDEIIREYQGQLQAAREWAQRASKSADLLVRPDWPTLEYESKRAREDVETALKLKQDLESELKTCDEWLSQLNQLENEFAMKDKENSVIGKIADIANGKNEYKMTFQGFVLSALLEDVLNAATQRLQVMSQGRYVLHRAQSPLNKRGMSGLDLVVSDTHTGDSRRPAETLSGGESFYTALALALGLAEVVQAYAGGIRLDTVFIDEGFGSLDSDTLDLAIRTLESLKEGGRLVGIISHVESLRERISTRLEVTASVNGSAARFSVG